MVSKLEQSYSETNGSFANTVAMCEDIWSEVTWQVLKAYMFLYLIFSINFHNKDNEYTCVYIYLGQTYRIEYT